MEQAFPSCRIRRNGEKAGVLQNPMLYVSWPQARLWRERSVAVGVQSKRSEACPAIEDRVEGNP